MQFVNNLSVLQILMAAQFDNLHQSLFSSGSTRKRPTNGTRFVKRNIESGQRGLINIKALVGNIWEAGTDCSVALQLRNMKRDDLQIREGFQYSDNPQCQTGNSGPSQTQQLEARLLGRS